MLEQPRRPFCGCFRSFVLASFLAVCASAADAATCGDDIGGVRVPCDCGDVVVADTRLRPDDPVVTHRCGGDGLILRAENDAESLRLDLGGQTLLGVGRGNGIRVVNGGRKGAVIVGGTAAETGAIANFGTGLRALNPRTLAQVRNLRLSGNARDGAHLRTHGGILENVTAERNGRDGIRVGGRAPRLEHVETLHNGGFGVQAFGRGVAVDANAAGNRRGNVRALTDGRRQ